MPRGRRSASPSCSRISASPTPSYRGASSELRGYLAAQGIGPDDVVAVMMKNSAAFLEIAFATSHLGAVFLPINFRLAADEVEYIAANAGAKLVLADEEFAAAVANLPRHGPARRRRAGRHHHAFGRISAGADAGAQAE